MSKAKRKPLTLAVSMQAKCINGHKFTMDSEAIKRAQDFGCAMCPKCGNPATISKINLTTK